MRPPITRWLFLLLFAALPLGTASGQATTAAIEGVVLDEGDEPLPGVNVIAVHEPTGTQYGAATNASGRYRILNMRVGGPYTVRASFIGFQTAEEDGVHLQLNQTQTVNFVLYDEARELEELQVIGRRSQTISPERTGASTNISEAEIESLPTIDRSLSDFARLVPQSGGGYSMGGRNARYNNIQVDGATLNDVFGLGDAVPGSQAGAQPISLDAIQEFNVDIAPYDVRAANFTGGQINAITKSGSNQFSGTLRALGRNADLVGTLGGPQVDDFGEYYFVGNLGGPIIQDELFFFVNAELVREGVPRSVQVDPAGGQNVFPVDPMAFEEIADITRTQYGYEPGHYNPLTQRTDNNKLLAKLDWNVAANHRLTMRHNYVGATDDSGLSRGTGSFDFTSQMYQFNSTQNSTAIELTSNFGDNTFNEARVVYTRIRDARDIGDQIFPSVSIRPDGNRTIGLGPGRFDQANRLDQDLIEITNNLTYIAGDHTLTFGTSNQIFSFANLFIRDFYGAYTFEPFELEDGTEISAIEAYRRGQPTSFNLSYATDVAGTERPEAQFTAFQPGLYVQNEWQATNNLRLTAGLRADVPIMPQEPSRNPATEEAFGLRTDQTASGNFLWSPRVGFNYSTGGEFQTQFRGGTGIFSGPPPFVWISNQYSNTGVDVARVNAFFNPGEAFYGEEYGPEGRQFFQTDRLDQPRPADDPLLSPEETTEVNLIDPDFRYPQTWRTNIAIDQELPLGFVATLEGIFAQNVNEIAYENLNLEQVGESAYGRPLYGTPRGTRPDRALVDERFTDALYLTNTNQGYDYNITAQIQRRQVAGLNGSLSYTYTRAENINSGTSSQAVSNWRFNPSFDINNPGMAPADFERRHRLLANLSYRLTYGERFASTLGVVYDGRSGAPFSWIHFGDANASGTNNDLMYIPRSEDEVFLLSDNWHMLDAFIRGRPAMQEARGGVMGRNSDRDPWSHLIDLRFTQHIATFEGQRVELTANLQNVLNFLNNEWGIVRFSSFNEQYGWDFERYIDEGDIGNEVAGRVVTADDIGKPVINASERFLLQPRLADEEFSTSFTQSAWRMQFGIRYTF